MLRASQIEPNGFTSSSPTRALWCQSANTDSNNGMWFQPPGSIPVSSADIDGPPDEPYHMVMCPGQVGLVRDIGLAGTDTIGLVQCMIRDEMNITHTLTTGVYTGAIYDNYGEYRRHSVFVYYTHNPYRQSSGWHQHAVCSHVLTRCWPTCLHSLFQFLQWTTHHGDMYKKQFTYKHNIFSRGSSITVCAEWWSWLCQCIRARHAWCDQSDSDCEGERGRRVWVHCDCNG